MLGKNNFKERLRRMEEQNKKERFSIRKLSIGAASVLIGFAFMGMGAQTVQADQVTSTVKQEVKAAGDQAEQKDADKIDQPAVNTPAAEQITTPKTGEVPKQAAEKQVEATVKPATETKNNNSEQNKKPQAVNKNDAKNVQTEAQDQTAKNDSAATEPNKQNSATTKTHEAQKATGQTTQADQSQNRTSNSESTTNDQHNANSGNVELDKNDQVRNQNNQVTDKANDVENAVSQLQKAMNQATVLANKTNLNKNLTAEQKGQLQQIDEIVSSGQAVVDRYNTQKMEGQALTASLGNNPENSDNRGNGNAANTQTLDVSRLSKITHNLNGLLQSLAYVPGQATQNVSTWDEFASAYQDNNVKTINLTGDINDTVLNGPVLKRDTDLVVNGNNKTISVINTNGVANFYLNAGTTITFNNVKFNKTDSNKDQNQTPLFSAYASYYRDQTVPVLNLNNATFKNVPIIVGIDGWGGAPTVSVNLGGDINLDINTSYHLNNNVNTIYRPGSTWLAPLFSVMSDFGGVINVLANANVNTVNGSILKVPFLGTGNINILGNVSLKYDMRDVGSFFAQGDAGSAITVGGHAQVNIVGNNDTTSITSHPWTPNNVFESTFKGKYAEFTVNDDAQVNINLTGAKSSAAPVGLISKGVGTRGFHINDNGTLNITSSLPIVGGVTFTSTLVEGTGNSLIHLTDTSTNNDGLLATAMGDYGITGTNVILQKDDGTFDARKVKLANHDYVAITDSNGKTKLFHIGDLPYGYVNSSDGKGLKYLNMYLTVDRANEKIGSTTSAEDILKEGLGTPLYQLSDQAAYNAMADAGSYKRIAWGPRADILIPTTDAAIYNASASVQNAHINQLSPLHPDSLVGFKDYFNPDQTINPGSEVESVEWVKGVIVKQQDSTDSTKFNGIYNEDTLGAIDPGTGKLREGALNKTDLQLGNATIKVTYTDGSVDYVPVKINIVSAKAKNGSVQTTETSSQTNPISVNFKEPSDTNATGLIANGSDLSQWSPEYSFVDAAGNPITAFGSGTNITGDPNHKLVETNIKVQYHNGGADDGNQTIQHVWLKVEKTTADRYTNDVTSAGIDKVLQGATFDAQDAVKVSGEAASHLATTNPYSWTTTPVLQSSGANAGKYVGTAQVKFSDGSVKDVQVIYSQVAKSSAKTGLVFNADGLEADARADATKGLFNTNNKGQGLITIVNDNTADGLNIDGLTNPIAAGNHNVTVKVKVADDVWTKGVTTGATNNKGGFYNVDVPVNVQNMNTAYEGHITYNEAAPIKGHIVNYGTTEQKYDQFQNTSSNFADFLNVTDSAGTTNLTTEQKKGIIKSFEWGTAPRTATAGEKDATLKVVFADNSVSDLIRVKVNIASGASVTLSQHVKSGSKITDTNFPQPTSVSLSGGYTQGTGSKWVNVYHNGTNDFYIDRSGNPDRIMWPEAEGTQPVHDSQTLYYKVVYSDGSAEVVPVTAQITPMKDWMSSDIQVDPSVTFHNAQLDYAPDGYTNPEDPSQSGKTLVKYNGTNVTYVDEYHTSNEDIKSINWQNSDNINDLLNPEHVTSATTTSPENIQITFSDGSKLEKSVSVSVISALGHDATINALPSNAASDDSALAEILHQAISNKSTIDNYVDASDPSSYQIINPASGNDLSLDDLKKKQTNLPLHILVNYKDGSSQEVDVNLNVNGIGDQLDQAHNVHGESDVEAHVVNTGDMSDAANYANSLLSTSDTITYTDASGVHNHVSLTSLGADRISWTTTPDLTQIDSNGTDHEVTVHFSDNSTANIKFKLKIVGANTSDLTHAIYGGHTSPAAQAQISNREDLATKFGTSDSSYSWYKKDEHGNYVRMSDTDFNEVISSGNEDNAWIKVDWGDGTSQMAGLKLNLLSYHDAYHPTPRPIPVTPGENPTDITNPTPEEPTPGVDPNTVPSGSHTILDPSQPAPDTTTPGTHPVHVIVVYPDGSQSDPIETNIVVPDENTPSYEDTSVGETISPVIIFRDNHDKAIKTLTDKISGYEGSTIPLETLKKLIAEEMPEGYALDMDLEQAWREGKFVITVNHPIYIKIVKVRRQLVLFVDKRGRIVKRAYVLIKESQKLSNEVVKSLTGKDMPNGYKMNGYKKVAKHIDIFVSGKQTKATSHGKLVLYVRKDGKIVKKLNIQLVANKFSKRNAKMHLPKGYKMTGHTHINRHNDVWVIKK